MVTGGWLMERGLQDSVYDRARLFDDVKMHVARYYVDTVDQRDLYQKALDGMLYELHDPHSVFLTPDRLRKLTESTSGRYGGIGVQIEPRDGWITVVSALPETPAERAGINTGDRIVDIDGKPTKGLTPDEAMKSLRGEPGTDVHLTLERPGLATPIPVTLTRREIKVRAVQHTALLREGVGYLGLTNVFSENMDDEVRAAVERLRSQGMRELVIDLRGNPGGLLDQGVAVSDLFLDPGQRIVSMKGRTPDANREYTDRAPQRWPELPIVVLIDSGSASASEIFAGALQDHDRAVLVGTTSYGKGSAQSLFPMANGGALKLTTARWFTPSGRSISRPHKRPGDDSGDEEESEDDSAAARPEFRTDGGRTVYGGGGITPDVVVTDTARSAAELAFQRALGKNVAQFRDALADYALTVKTAHAVTSPDFAVTPAMLEELWRRMEKRGIAINKDVYDDAAPLVSRLLGYEITRYAFGPEAEFQRQLTNDGTLQVALGLATGAHTQKELLQRSERAAKASGAKPRP
jgi:carboxyl-terminal processing protease